ncbi:MAG: hypothetical protein AMXMBFR84_11340 [Candidatus Hydrogenedentota bacterium]
MRRTVYRQLAVLGLSGFSTLCLAAEIQYSAEFVIAQKIPEHSEKNVSDEATENSQRNPSILEPVDVNGGEIDHAWIHQSYTVLAAPRIVTLEGAEANIRIGGDVPLQYFEFVGDNRYELKNSDTAPGIELAASFTPLDNPAKVALRMTCNVAAVAARAPVEGTQLPVGKPDIRTLASTLDTPEAIELGKWMVLTVQDDQAIQSEASTPAEAQVKIAVYFRVTEYKPQDSKAE